MIDQNGPHTGVWILEERHSHVEEAMSYNHSFVETCAFAKSHSEKMLENYWA